MTDITRYTISGNKRVTNEDGYTSRVEEQPANITQDRSGIWVLYEDHLESLVEVGGVIAELRKSDTEHKEEMRAQQTKFLDRINALEAEIDRLRKGSDGK